MKFSKFSNLCLYLLIFIGVSDQIAIAAPTTRYTYNPNSAVTYAIRNYNISYVSGSNRNPFGNFTDNNCTNFVSQCIIAGLSGKTTPAEAFAVRSNFWADRGTPLAWFYNTMADRGPAFSGAKDLYNYARQNRASYKGMHFSYVTNDSPTYRMNYEIVKAGDVIFADWESDGRIDHTMIVNRYDNCTLCTTRGYNRVRVTYQSNNVTDRGLEDINNLYNRRVSFYVYRPTDYNQSGL